MHTLMPDSVHTNQILNPYMTAVKSNKQNLHVLYDDVHTHECAIHMHIHADMHTYINVHVCIFHTCTHMWKCDNIFNILVECRNQLCNTDMRMHNVYR